MNQDLPAIWYRCHDPEPDFYGRRDPMANIRQILQGHHKQKTKLQTSQLHKTKN